jgi:hypothetical protein
LATPRSRLRKLAQLGENLIGALLRRAANLDD